MCVQVGSLVHMCPHLRDVDLFGVKGLPRGCQVARACFYDACHTWNLSLYQAATKTSVARLQELFAMNAD